jgi:formylglycine-generating enzyme required for sulfatase activity
MAALGTALVASVAPIAIAQDPPAQSEFTRAALDGSLTWSAAGGAPIAYRIEWLPATVDPWRRSWKSLECFDWREGPPASLPAPVPALLAPGFFRLAALFEPPDTRMALVDAGPFDMGGPIANLTDFATVTISAFWIERREVSKAQWDIVRAWGATNGFTDLRAGSPGSSLANPSDHPVTDITWYDAVKWCNARSLMEGLDPVYYTAPDQTAVYTNGALALTASCVRWHVNGYRLPTHAEWEKAARGGLARHHYPWPSAGGSYLAHLLPVYANYWSSGDPFQGGTSPVGYYNGSQIVTNGAGVAQPVEDMANAYGLYDMAGNVQEWVWNRGVASWGRDPPLDPRGPDDAHITTRGTRGGDINSSGENVWVLRCGDSLGQAASSWGYYVGFRCVRSAP